MNKTSSSWCHISHDQSDLMHAFGIDPAEEMTTDDPLSSCNSTGSFSDMLYAAMVSERSFSRDPGESIQVLVGFGVATEQVAAEMVRQHAGPHPLLLRSPRIRSAPRSGPRSAPFARLPSLLSRRDTLAPPPSSPPGT